jgi:hypothetical protein
MSEPKYHTPKPVPVPAGAGGGGYPQNAPTKATTPIRGSGAATRGNKTRGLVS